MRNKRLRFYYLLSMLTIGGSAILTGCADENDVYNPDRIQEEAKKAFPVKNVDPTQTWETSAMCNASVSINEESSETYTLKIYTANPYNVSGNAKLLAKTTLSSKQVTHFKFDIPASLKTVFVMKINSKGYSSALPVAVENGEMKALFGAEAKTRAVETRNAVTRANTWTPNVPAISDTQIFPHEAPAGSMEYKGDWEVKAGGNYIITSDITVNCNNAANFYIKGNVTLNSIYAGGSNATKIIVLPGATLTLPNGFSYGEKGELSIGKGATLICSSFSPSNSFGNVYNAGTIQSAGAYTDSRSNNAAFYNLGTFLFTDANLSSINFYNAGTIKARKIDNNNQTYFINAPDAQMTLTDKFSCENGNTVTTNAGQLTAGSFGIAGGSAFYNDPTGQVTIAGESSIDSSSSIWDNLGSFKTKTMTFKSASRQWYNRCKLYVDEKLTLTTSGGVLVMDAGAYAQCKELEMDMSRVELGNNAFFEVLNTAFLKWNTDNNGFYATGNDFALLKMGKAAPQGDLSSTRQTYSGKLYVACNNHFEQGDQYNKYYTVDKGALLTAADNADIKIPATTCNPGYNTTPDGGGSSEVQSFAYAFEDMVVAGGDYDFNDVVLYVSNPIDGKIKVSLVAAGAIKELAVRFKQGENVQTIFSSVHQALGVKPGVVTNTGGNTGKVSTAEISVGSNFSLTEQGDIYISDGKKEVHIPKFTAGFKPGDVPYAIRVASPTWAWPKESIKITEAYPTFEEWAQDATSETKWYNYPEADKVIIQ